MLAALPGNLTFALFAAGAVTVFLFLLFLKKPVIGVAGGIAFPAFLDSGSVAGNDLGGDRSYCQKSGEEQDES